MAEKLHPFYKLLKTDTQINITQDLVDTFEMVNKALDDACELALKQPLPGKQLVLMTDASFRSAGYALMIEDDPEQKITQNAKLSHQLLLAQKFSPQLNLKCQFIQKNF